MIICQIIVPKVSQVALEHYYCFYYQFSTLGFNSSYSYGLSDNTRVPHMGSQGPLMGPFPTEKVVIFSQKFDRKTPKEDT